MPPTDCSQALIPARVDISYDDVTDLSLAWNMSESAYDQAKQQFGASAVIYGVPISANYDDFHQSIRTKAESLGINNFEQRSFAYATSALTAQNLQAYRDCLMLSAGLFLVAGARGTGSCQIWLSYSPPVNVGPNLVGKVLNSNNVEPVSLQTVSRQITSMHFHDKVDSQFALTPKNLDAEMTIDVAVGNQTRSLLLPPLRAPTPTPVTPAAPPKIVTVQMPVDAADGPSWPRNQNCWRADFPIHNTNQIGIGYIIEPPGFDPDALIREPFAMHDHHYQASQVPDPTRALVTFSFDKPAEISGVKIIQHTNGVSQIEGFIGQSADSLISMGIAESAFGDVPQGNLRFPEGYVDTFHFRQRATGKVFRFIIRKTSLSNGYAIHKAYPVDRSGQTYAPAM